MKISTVQIFTLNYKYYRERFTPLFYLTVQYFNAKTAIKVVVNFL